MTGSPDKAEALRQLASNAAHELICIGEILTYIGANDDGVAGGPIEWLGKQALNRAGIVFDAVRELSDRKS